MKKYMFSFVLALVAVQFSFAQDLNSLIMEMAKIDGANHQVVDREMLNMSMKSAIEDDKSGELSKKTAFMQKLDSVVVVTIEECKPELTDIYLKEFEKFKDGDGYETLFTVRDEEDNVRIISHKDGEIISDVYILVWDGKDIVAVKLSGKLTDSDLVEIINKQKEQRNKQN